MDANILTLLGALGIGGIVQAIITHYFQRKVTDADATVKIVAASSDFTDTVMQRLSAVEAKVEMLEHENTLLRKQIFQLGQIPLVFPEPAKGKDES